jgi:hypothetical protein
LYSSSLSVGRLLINDTNPFKSLLIGIAYYSGEYVKCLFHEHFMTFFGPIEVRSRTAEHRRHHVLNYLSFTDWLKRILCKGRYRLDNATQARESINVNPDADIKCPQKFIRNWMTLSKYWTVPCSPYARTPLTSLKESAGGAAMPDRSPVNQPPG